MTTLQVVTHAVCVCVCVIKKKQRGGGNETPTPVGGLNPRLLHNFAKDVIGCSQY